MIIKLSNKKIIKMSKMKTQDNLHRKLDSNYQSSGLKTNFMKNINRLHGTTKAGHSKYSRKGSAQTQKSGQLSKGTFQESSHSPTSIKRAITQSYIQISQKSGIFSEAGSPLRKKENNLRKSMKVSTLEIDDLINNQGHFQPVIEFISYCLSKSEKTEDSSQLLKAKYALQLQNIQQKVQKAHQQLIILSNSRPNLNQAVANIKEQELKTQQLTEQTNMEILKMVSSRADYRDLKRHIKKTIAQLQQKQQQYDKSFEAEQKCQLDKIGEQMKIKNSLTETINQLQYEMSTIKKFRESIKDKKERVRVTAKTQKSFYVLYDQLIKQKSSKDLKLQLEGSQKLLDNFYKSMDKKVQIIKNAVATHNETHQFLASLDIHNESLSVKLTKEAYELSQTEKKGLDQMKTQMNVYRQFLKGEGEFKKISGALQNIEQKCEQNLKKMKQQIDEMHIMNTEQQKKLSELQSIQIIREAEIQQLSAILKQKKSEILRSKVRSDQTDSFEIFRNSIANFGKKKSNVSNY